VIALLDYGPEPIPLGDVDKMLRGDLQTILATALRGADIEWSRGLLVSILAVISSPSDASSALKAGCHAVLLKPFSLNLVAARLGRLCREMPAAAAVTRLGATVQQWGTNRVWPEMSCPQCGERGAVCFEYASHRRSWYACLACDHAWLGARRE